MRNGVASDAILERLLALHPKIIDLTLDRVWRLLDIMDNPERALPPVVHIAGTNGKGSTLAMIRAGLEGAGGRVHAYTSPHLVRFHERIRLAGSLIGESDLSGLLEECEARNGAAPITFFEITTVAALTAFARTPADWLLLEVGLGGRLDATNVVAGPALCVITPISIDHQQYLGESLEDIAREKSGILKPGVPCIVGPQPDAAWEVIESHAATIGASLRIHGQDWIARQERDRLVFEDEHGLLDLALPRLLGRHQIDNAGVAIAALRALGQDAPAFEAVPGGASWPARMQRLKRGPLVDLLPAGAELWLDGGHNAAAGQAIAATVSDLSQRAPAVLRLIIGMLDTKAAEDFLAPFASLAEGAAAVTIPDTMAAIPANELAGRARNAGIAAVSALSVEEALMAMLDTHSGGPLRILICGSLYLAGHVLDGNA